ncbi:CxxC-x17-CxxC domain-containing protein [Nitrosopumilus sp. S4]
MELYKSKYSDKKKSHRTSRDNDTSRSYRNSRNDRDSRYSRNDRREESATVTCAACGTECQVPFVPRTDRPVYCNDCFRQNKPQDSASDRYSRNDRNSRNDRDSRYSRNDRREESATVTCAACGTECQVPFVPRTDRPVYCNDCFRQNKPQDSASDRYSRNDRNSRNDRDSRYSRNDRREESATVTCADCGTECQVPFVPRTDRPVYCNDCFRQNKSQDSASDRYSRNDRNSRNDRDSRYSRNDRESSRDRTSSRKPKNEKFLKKRESFFANASDKFYESLKEKLFEILGGKSCSSCGFKDERALGISHIFEENGFDDVKRGGAASSWGKYISEPELAREELKVLCLNCNQIRQPVTKPKVEKVKPKQKKSRYFPR